MRNITEELENIYLPKKALVINQCKADENKIYIEAYDFDRHGRPINAHPLSAKEMEQLALSLKSSTDLKQEHLYNKSLLPSNLLYIQKKQPGFAMWFTPPMKVNMLFKEKLSIPNGKAYVPSLIWKADKENLWLYAQPEKSRPTIKTGLCKAPFFNLHESGKVCMGTVDIEIDDSCSLEEFIKCWEHYFWNSYFSHLIETTSPVNTNIVELWQTQIATGQKFPADVLVNIKLTIKDLIK